MRHSTSIVVTVGLCGCASAPCPPEAPDSSGQSYKQAIALICDVDQRAGIGEEVDPIDRAGRRSDYINENVKNPDGIEYRTYFSVKPTVDQARSLENEAKIVGIQSCALVSSLRKEG